MVVQGVRNRTFTILMRMRTAMCSHCMLMVARPLSFEIRVVFVSDPAHLRAQGCESIGGTERPMCVAARRQTLTPGGAGTHTGAHKGTRRSRIDVDKRRRGPETEPCTMNHPNPPTYTTPARQRDDLETAADSTAAGPEPTAPPRGRLRRGRPQSEPDPATTLSTLPLPER